MSSRARAARGEKSGAVAAAAAAAAAAVAAVAIGGEAAAASPSPTPALHVVAAILAQREVRGVTQYRIQWEGHATPTWEAAHNLKACEDALKDFHARQRKKRGPQQQQRPNDSDDTSEPEENENTPAAATTDATSAATPSRRKSQRNAPSPRPRSPQGASPLPRARRGAASTPPAMAVPVPAVPILAAAAVRKADLPVAVPATTPRGRRTKKNSHDREADDLITESVPSAQANFIDHQQQMDYQQQLIQHRQYAQFYAMWAAQTQVMAQAHAQMQAQAAMHDVTPQIEQPIEQVAAFAPAAVVPPAAIAPAAVAEVKPEHEPELEPITTIDAEMPLVATPDTAPEAAAAASADADEVPLHTSTELEEGDDQDAYTQYWQHSAEASAMGGHSLFPPDQQPSFNGVSPCKISVVNPLFDPLEQLGRHQAHVEVHAMEIEPSDPAATAKVSTGAPLTWVEEEQRTWEWSKTHMDEWVQQTAANAEAESGDLAMDTEPTAVTDSTDRKRESSDSDAGIATSTGARLDDALLLPTIHLNGTSYQCVASLPTVSRTRSRVFEDEPEVTPLSPQTSSRAPSQPASPFHSPRASPAPSAAEKLQSRLLFELGPAAPRPRKGQAPSASPASMAALLAANTLPPSGRRNNDVEIALSGNPHTPRGRATRSTDEAAPPALSLSASRSRRGLELPPSAAPRLGRGSSASKLPSPAASPHPSPEPTPLLTAEELVEEARLLRRKGHLTSADNTKLKMLTNKRNGLPFLLPGLLSPTVAPAASPSPSPLPVPSSVQAEPPSASTASAPPSAAPSTAVTPDAEVTSVVDAPASPSLSTASSVTSVPAPPNRRERRQQQRDQAALKKGASDRQTEPDSESDQPQSRSRTRAKPAQLDVPEDNAHPPVVAMDTPSRRTRASSKDGGTPSILTSAPALIPNSPTAPGSGSSLTTPSRSSRSQLDLSGMLMTPRDWPSERYRKRGSHASPSLSSTAVAEPGVPMDLDAVPLTPVAKRSHSKRKLSIADTDEAPTAAADEDAPGLVVKGSKLPVLLEEEDESSPPPPKKQRVQLNNTAAASSSSAVVPAPAKFIYGNYDAYYGQPCYRNTRPWVDARMSFLQASWFTGKTVLDLGCNAGQLSILLASTPGYTPARVVGLDIDEKLVRQARDKLQQRATFLAAENSSSTSRTTSKGARKPQLQLASSSAASPPPPTSPFANAPVSSLSRFAPASSSAKLRLSMGSPTPTAAAAGTPVSPPASSLFPGNVSFEVGDLLTAAFPPSDVVLVMSLTKWVHFHHGDAGIHELFAKVHRALPKGGLCILEPQPWKSYKKKASLTPEIKANYKLIQLKPEDFPAYVTRTHGWVLKHTFHVSSVVDKPDEKLTEKGFNVRPIYVFEKK